MIVAKITHDYINAKGSEYYRVGKTFELLEHHVLDLFPNDVLPKPNDGSFLTTRFRVLDDDRQVYYGGWLINDPGCEIQQEVVAWSTYDAGAIHIQVKNDKGNWVYEIG